MTVIRKNMLETMEQEWGPDGERFRHPSEDGQQKKVGRMGYEQVHGHVRP